jgi:bifunctional UDP-N-acetylglucosamine pyrophosphorylase/glucosamine-1-phosphate N-acetyltransferase
MSFALIVLAAGKGTRMNSDMPKVLHPLGGAPLLYHALKAGRALDADRTVVVAGHGAEAVTKAAHAYDPDIAITVQADQNGTAHAVQQAAAALAGFEGDAIVLYGDTPFVRPETLQDMLDRRRGGDTVVVLGFEAPYPGRYGRLILNRDGSLARIVEAKDATQADLNVTLCNSGVVCADAATLIDLVSRVEPSPVSGEYYLTDIVALANADGGRCSVVTCDEDETLGIDTRAALSAAERNFQTLARAEAIDNGVLMAAPDTVHFAYDTIIGRDAVIGPNVVFGPGVTIESGAEIKAFSHLEGCHVSRGAVVGPFARLRPGAELADNARVGNFVEVKEALVGEGAKINHLSYVGDAEIGAGANIGAGTITCNYDGVMKHRTVIGANAFIGSNTALVAPVSVGAEAMTGSGSVITRDVPDGALAVARADQVNRPGLAVRLVARLKAVKAKLKEENS